MSASTRPSIQGSTDCSFSRSEQRNTIGSFASASDSEIWSKDSDTSRLELQYSTYQPTPSPRPVTVLAEQKAHLMYKRTRPGRRQQLYLDWLTAYRVLIASVFLINLGVLVPIHTSRLNTEAPLTATAANVMIAVLLRQEEIINFGFRHVSKLPTTLPFAVRQAISDFHHYGGVHIGCAVSALLWYCMFVGLNTVRVVDLIKLDKMSPTLYINVATAYAALFAILLICATAIPRFRVRFHNTFEATHRFAGWGVLAVLWIHAGIATLNSDVSNPLYAQPFIWMLAVTTLLIVYPWLRIRRVPITAFPISAHEIQLTFPYNSMPYTSTIRTSTAPLTEWHAFATIPISSTTSKIIISQAGDWTKSIIASPPTELWIRHPPMLNFLTLAPLFNSLLLVATGAGIGPMLSLLTSPALENMRQQGRVVRVLWCAYEPYATHWAFALDIIRNIDKNAKVFDSKAGRPDMAFEARYLAETTCVEAVMVVSNPKVTKEVVDECKIHKIAGYGAVFDS